MTVGELAIGVAVHRGVERRIDEHLRAHRAAFVARGHRGQVAAGAVAADDHAGGVGAELGRARGRRPRHRGARVLHGRGVGVLGRQAVVDAQAHRARGVGELARDAVEGLDVAHVPAAAVQPDEHAQGVGGDGRPVDACPDATALGVGDHDVLDARDLLHGPAELERGLQVGGALGLEVRGAGVALLRGGGLDQRADLRVQAGAHALASAPVPAAMAASMRCAIARPVKPTSACSSAGLPCVT